MLLTNEGRVLNRNHAFFFCDLVSLIFLMVSVVSQIFLAGKFEILGGFIKPDKKIIKLYAAALGPKAGAEREKYAWFSFKSRFGDN